MEEKIQRLKERKVTYTHLLDDLEARGENQVSLTDPDSRAMPKSPQAKVGYNVQTATDDKHHLIVEQDVTNQANDKAQLSKISIGAKAVLNVDAFRVVADRGYYNGETIKACLEERIEPYVPKPDTSNSKSRGLFI
ncbi:MAG: transposase [Candidatus Latescibacteria bacterium]|nr:transposase [Candidatus Latescibacterota bacterium]